MLRAIKRPDLSAARRIREALGEVLRETRRHRGLTLREVAALAGSRFKPSAIGGYERGERSISLERFCDLAELYGVPADHLLSQVLARVKPEGRVEVVVDLTQLELLPGEEPRITAELIDRVRRQRGDLTGAQVTLRAGDLEALALASKLAPGDLVRRLEPALHLSGNQRGSDT